MVAPSGGGYGGVEVYTAAIAKEVMAHEQCEVRVVYRVMRGVPVADTLARGLAQFGVAWRVICRLDWQYLRDLLWADIVHCHFPVVYATYPARLLGKKLIITVEAKRNPAHHGIKFGMGLKLAHVQWYISRFVADTWGAAAVNENCRIVPAISDLPSTYTAPAARKGFFFIARWVPLKGLEQLVEAYATANLDRPQHPLFLYGDGMLRDKIERLVDQWGVREYVAMPGFVSAAVKEQQMSAARWNVAPVAFPEDLGLTPIEARCCGVPSIVSRIGGLPEAAGEQALFCEPGNVASLRRSLEQAAGMSDAEYEQRARICKESLLTYLPPVGFYYQEYIRVLGLQDGSTVK